MSVPNFSSLAGLEVGEKFVLGGGGGEITWNLYRASRCDIEKQTFLYIDICQNLFYSLFVFHFLILKNLQGNL